MKTICIKCPIGCPIEIREDYGKIYVTGNGCARGRDYGVTEFLRPMRSIATLVQRADEAVVSVKTSQPIPKDKIFDFQRRIKEIVAPQSVRPGDVIEKGILGLDVDVVVTGVPPISK